MSRTFHKSPDPWRVRKAPQPARRPSTHHPRCRCPTCQPKLDFDGKRRAAERTEMERLQAELTRLRAQKAAAPPAPAPAAPLRPSTTTETERRRRALMDAAEVHDPRTDRLQKLMNSGLSLSQAIARIEGRDDDGNA